MLTGKKPASIIASFIRCRRKDFLLYMTDNKYTKAVQWRYVLVHKSANIGMMKALVWVNVRMAD